MRTTLTEPSTPGRSVPVDDRPGSLAALLLLADGRFPTGGHAHSGGFEAAAVTDALGDVPALEGFLRGRLTTVGLVAAAFAGAACRMFAETARDGADVTAALLPLDTEFNARTPSPTLRTVSRRLGRSVLRVGGTVWPHAGLQRIASLPGNGLHQPVAFGAVAAAAGLTSRDAAYLAAYESIAGPATAAIRLLGLDPFQVNAALARLGAQVAEVADEAAGYRDAPPAELPARAGFLLEIFAEVHATWEVRLFAS
ncbi:urease accessory protein UreF [Homoserinimonas sp. A520]